MKALKVFALAGVSGMVAVGIVATPLQAFAWEPKGAIKKSAQNQTTGTPLSDANTQETAVLAKPGDLIKYVIEIRNDGTKGSDNELHFAMLTDNLPAGVQLVSNPSARQISENLGVIKPGEKVTKEYLVKVISSKDEIIENKACFSGDSAVKDKPQQGCDSANIKVSVPKEEPKPTPVPTPEAPKPPLPAPAPKVLPATTELPQTGASEWIAPLSALTGGSAAYASRLLVIKRRQK